MLPQFVSFKLAQLAALLALPQFDVSSQLLLPHQSVLERLKQRLVAWDVVYYLSGAQAGGPRYEHEWAFSPTWGRLIRSVAQSDDLGTLALYGAVIATTSHFIACVLVYMIARVLGKSRVLARSAAGLYVFSPAGIFLTAAYPESTFALLSFAGILLFLEEHYVTAGALFGVACWLRSNGLLWGILFLYALATARTVKAKIRVFFGGALIGAAFAYPQYSAYSQLCPGRPWCDRTIPLIYSFVQKEYWNNGFLEYWTPNNIPNFLFASPTIVLLVRSASAAPPPLRLVQISLVVGALLFWHVQIVTRVASCLPTPYLYLAERAGSREYKLWVTYFIVWGVAQAALFGGFLPPA